MKFTNNPSDTMFAYLSFGYGLEFLKRAGENLTMSSAAFKVTGEKVPELVQHLKQILDQIDQALKPITTSGDEEFDKQATSGIDMALAFFDGKSEELNREYQIAMQLQQLSGFDEDQIVKA